MKTNSPHEAQQVSLQAYKSLVSDYALRARQAEDMAAALLAKLPFDQTDMLVNKIRTHMDTRELERSTQYLGVLQVTLLALTNLQRSTVTPEDLNSELLEIIKALTITVNPN